MLVVIFKKHNKEKDTHFIYNMLMGENIIDLLATLRESDKRCEYDFLIALFLMMRLNSSQILLSELNVLSGFSLRFLYNYEHPEVYNMQLEYLTKNLKHFLNAKLSLIPISSRESFFEVLDNYKMLILYPYNTLFVKEGSIIKKIQSYFADEFSFENSENIEGTGVVLIDPGLKERDYFYSKEVYEGALKIALANFLQESISLGNVSVYIGKKAFEEFSNDLKDEEKDFQGNSRAWLGNSSQFQWSSLYGLSSYFLGVYHFLKMEVQEKANGIIRGFEDAVIFLREFNRVAGRDSYTPESKVASMEQRRRASNSLEKAQKSLQRSFDLLNLLFLEGSL